MSKSYPPSEKKLKELRELDIFPRSPALESTFALLGILVVIWIYGESAAKAYLSFGASSFGGVDFQHETSVQAIMQLTKFVGLIIVGAAAARLFIIKCESRILLKWPKIGFGRVFAATQNFSNYFSGVRRGLLFSTLLVALFGLIVILLLPRSYGLLSTTDSFSIGQLFIPAVALLLVGVVELFRNIVSFGSRYGMTREELIAEQQEMRPELRSEIQGRLSDVD